MGKITTYECSPLARLINREAVSVKVDRKQCRMPSRYDNTLYLLPLGNLSKRYWGYMVALGGKSCEVDLMELKTHQLITLGLAATAAKQLISEVQKVIGDSQYG